ncbi:MAG: glycerate kinase [Lentisphaeria bacterium]|nr:glycerate kinase [Lentisphaeria bacterium]
MNIIIATDSYKGCMRSGDVCAVIAAGFAAELPAAELCCVPMGDGGEGTLAAVAAATDATLRSVPALDPLGRPITAQYAMMPDGRRAFVEMAAASGIELLQATELDPLHATSYGTGQLISAAMDAGAKEIVVGIGGSATVDGGAGLLQALGCRLLDADGRELPPGDAALTRLAAIDSGGCEKRLRALRLQVACDVTNPLTGPRGAAAVFGPQKGATPAMVAELDAALAHWAVALQAQGLAKDLDQPGDGAAGGVGFVLRAVAGADLRSGARLVAELIGLPEKLRHADLLITGEGRTDRQSLDGKLPVALADLARAAGVPCVLLSGAIEGDQEALREHFAACFSTVSAVMPLNEVLIQARQSLYDQSRAIAAMLRLPHPY